MYDEGQEDEEYDWEWIQQILREQNRRVSLEDEEYEDDMLSCAGIIAYGLRKWGAVCKKGKRGLKHFHLFNKAFYRSPTLRLQ
ncbi:hypothetical protein CPB83DRAFT_863480 [Crepidotus variabilis]|uniref:Uncharacterized protein n=1 Tax=Crepidotus variabilis TaxID=179855 RepID=A0A9P6JIW4_9AGAR|nr:hypothetical protein CPB83DRAFT_864475 [Crepidotus variabilis]KAF9523109.1 hypothetical protein CPB83DRAFT_863480 [Crepidotus variabilis]